MEDIGFGLQRETSLGRTLSEVRTREEVDGEEREEREGEKRQKLEEEVVVSTTSPKQEGGGGGGLFDNLIAKLSSPRAASKPNGVEAVEADRNDIASSDGVEVQGSADTGVENGGGGGGGVFNNIISSFFNKSDEGEDVKNNGGEQGKEESENVEGEVAKEGVSQESESRTSNGGSIISSLVPYDVAPASDEASILIHSVVHD